MYCRKCGCQLKEDARFCTNCGASVVPEGKPVNPVNEKEGNSGFRAGANLGYDAGYSVSQKNAGRSDRGKASPKKFMKWIWLAIVAAAVVVAVVVVLNVSHTYKQPVKRYLAACEEMDAEALLSCYPDFMMDAILEELDMTRSELVEEYQDMLDEEIEWMDYFYDSYSLSFEMGDVEDCDEDEINSLRKEIRSELGLKSSEVPKIKKMKEVEVDFTARYVEYGERESETDIYMIYVGKIGLKWYVVNDEDIFY